MWTNILPTFQTQKSIFGDFVNINSSLKSNDNRFVTLYFEKNCPYLCWIILFTQKSSLKWIFRWGSSHPSWAHREYFALNTPIAKESRDIAWFFLNPIAILSPPVKVEISSHRSNLTSVKWLASYMFASDIHTKVGIVATFGIYWRTASVLEHTWMIRGAVVLLESLFWARGGCVKNKWVYNLTLWVPASLDNMVAN